MCDSFPHIGICVVSYIWVGCPSQSLPGLSRRIFTCVPLLPSWLQYIWWILTTAQTLASSSPCSAPRSLPCCMWSCPT